MGWYDFISTRKAKTPSENWDGTISFVGHSQPLFEQLVAHFPHKTQSSVNSPGEKLIGIAIIAIYCNISLFLLQIYHFILLLFIGTPSDIAINCQYIAIYLLTR